MATETRPFIERLLRTGDFAYVAARLAAAVFFMAWFLAEPGQQHPLSGLVIWAAFLALTGVYLAVCARRPGAPRLRWTMLACDTALLILLQALSGGASRSVFPGALALAGVYGFWLRGSGWIVAGSAASALVAWPVFSGAHVREGLLAGALAMTVAALAGLLARRQRRALSDVADLQDRLAQAQLRLRDTRAALKRHEEALRDAGQLAAVGQQSAEIAHEVRDPLSAISLLLEMLQDEIRKRIGADERDIEELIQLMEQQISSVTELTDNYLQFARLPVPRRRPEDVNRIVDEVLRPFRPVLEQRGIEVGRELDSSAPVGFVDRRQIKYVVRNLVKNSLEAMNGHGRLRLGTAAKDGTVDIVVSDTGRGIEPEHMGHIFEPFYSTKEAGAGLGLSLAERIVQRHGGQILCKSLREVGTTFRVRLPAYEKAVAEASDGDC